MHGQPFFVVHKLLHGNERIREIGHAVAVHARPDVVARPAVHEILSVFHAVKDTHGNERVGEELLLQPLDEVLGDGKLPDEPIELGIHGGLEHLVGGEGFGIAGFEADPLAALAMDAVCEGELHGGGEIIVSRRTPLGGLAGHEGFHAADAAPVPCFFERHAFLHEHLEADFLVVDGGETGTGPHQLGDFKEIVLGVLLAQAHGHGGLDHLEVDGGLEHEVRELVDAVLPCFAVEPAEADILEGAVPRIVLDARFVPVPHGVVAFDPETLNEFEGGGVVEDALCPVTQIIGVEILIHAARRIAARVAFHVQAHEQEMDLLECLPEGGGRVVREEGAVGSDVEELRFADWATLPCGEGFGGFGVPAAEDAEPFIDDDGRLPEVALLIVGGYGEVHGIEKRLRLVLNTLEALG